MKWLISGVIILAIISGIIFWQSGFNIFNRTTPTNNQEIELVFWNIGEDEKIYRAVLDAYHQAHPQVKIKYVKQSATNYRTRLQTQLRASQGPDLFIIHQSWLPMFKGDLAIAPETIYPFSTFEKNFYPVISKSLTIDKKIYAAPLFLDGLVLFANEDILKAAGVTVPKNWQEFIEIAKKLTVKNSSGQIQTSGAAMGAFNVDFWPEIVSLLFFQQPEGDLSSPGNKDGAEVLQFFTNFIIDPRLKIWDVNLPSSTTMFVSGKLAFYLAPSRMSQQIKNISPNLNFKIYPVPQLSSDQANLATFWAVAISGRSSFSREAWQFLEYLTSEEGVSLINQSKLADQQSLLPAAQTGFSQSQINDPYLKPVLEQALSYQTWYLNSQTEDAGINQAMIDLYQGAIMAVLGGQNAQTTLQNITPGIGEVLGKY